MRFSGDSRPTLSPVMEGRKTGGERSHVLVQNEGWRMGQEGTEGRDRKIGKEGGLAGSWNEKGRTDEGRRAARGREGVREWTK